MAKEMKFSDSLDGIDPESLISKNEKDAKKEVQEDSFFDHFLLSGGFKEYGGEDIDEDFEFSDDDSDSEEYSLEDELS